MVIKIIFFYIYKYLINFISYYCFLIGIDDKNYGGSCSVSGLSMVLFISEEMEAY